MLFSQFFVANNFEIILNIPTVDGVELPMVFRRVPVFAPVMVILYTNDLFETK